jgi:hypothetical protein
MNDSITPEAIRVTEFSTSMIDECTDLFLNVFTREPWNDHWESPQDAKRYLESHYAFNSFLGYVAVYEGRIVGASFGFIKPWQRGFEYYINEFFVDTAVLCSGQKHIAPQRAQSSQRFGALQQRRFLRALSELCGKNSRPASSISR